MYERDGTHTGGCGPAARGGSMVTAQKGKSSWIKHLDFIIWDIIMLQVAFIATYFSRFPYAESPYMAHGYKNFIILYTFILVAVGIATGNYSGILRRTNTQEFKQIIEMTIVSMFTTIMMLYALHAASDFSRVVFFAMSMCYAGLDLTARCLYKKHLIAYYGKHPEKLAALVIVADSEHARAIVEMLRTTSPMLYNIKGVILLDEVQRMRVSSGVPVLASIGDAAEYICHAWVDEVLVCNSSGNSIPQDFFAVCAEMGVTVSSIVNIKDVENKRVTITKMAGHTVLRTAYNYISPAEKFGKRLIDLVGGLIGSIFAIIIIILIGPIIYVKSPGRIIFTQERVGRNGKRFKLYKLRSMYPDAEERKKEYMAQNRIADGMMFKLDFDPRIIGNRELPNGKRKTGIGEFIRKTSLDEFPQFFNVLKGDMSVVGTRPPTVDEWERYSYHHRARLIMKPGITGLWQVSGRSSITDFEEVVKLDTEYISTFSLEQDVEIIFKTVRAVFRGRGAM